MANKLRRIQPRIQRRIENRAKDYPIPEIVPLDKEVLKARRSLLTNVTLLLKVFPVLTCNGVKPGDATEDLKYVGTNALMFAIGAKRFTRPSGHKARLCGVFKYESYQGTHYWERSSVNDLVPEKVV
ncbi:unnamed protein product [Brassica rapa]|uniref:APO domain-containing protein n=1 Tax=Brassica campestris TaxID=3711 RepID=A0A3P6ADC0_BRACM|nr:unnamed protein product [Brassica rapa]VDC82181.1 unnamed protein product [Brassica rapa]